ncbi:olfactory receptor 56A4-like [Pleurodeles waltl]|uniref:olfactory receptor 56A4-like n=1 Tax=Pleurodeles waltl TaxID=8319 RepID=UPI003709392A
MRKKEINDLKEIEDKERKLQVADAIRRLVKLCVAADRLREEKTAMAVVARTSQTGEVVDLYSSPMNFRSTLRCFRIELQYVCPTEMMVFNFSSLEDTDFILVGLPGFISWQHWLSIPLALLFLLAVLANLTLLSTIYREESLHEPMYYFLAALSLTDLILSVVTTPKILVIFWFNDRNISPTACFSQMYFVHCFLGLESGIFLAMAYDRYIAICYPLQYALIITDRFIMKVMVLTIVRPACLAIPLPIFAAQLHYCSSHVVEHSFCANVAVAKLACSNIRLNSIYQLVIAGSVLGVDLILISLSYCLIIYAVSKLHSQGAASKAFSTCTSHLILILFFYSTLMVLAVTNKSEEHVSPDFAILLNVLHLIVPPALNPLVYGVRTKEINHGIRKIYSNTLCYSTLE